MEYSVTTKIATGLLRELLKVHEEALAEIGHHEEWPYDPCTCGACVVCKSKEVVKAFETAGGFFTEPKPISGAAAWPNPVRAAQDRVISAVFPAVSYDAPGALGQPGADAPSKEEQHKIGESGCGCVCTGHPGVEGPPGPPVEVTASKELAERLYTHIQVRLTQGYGKTVQEFAEILQHAARMEKVWDKPGIALLLKPHPSIPRRISLEVTVAPYCSYETTFYLNEG